MSSHAAALMGMGFSREMVENALLISGGKFDGALNLLMEWSSEGSGGIGGGGSGGGFHSSSHDPRSGHAVGVESTLIGALDVDRENGRLIQVRRGDMTKENVDAIVNAANKHLDHASGLAGAIRRNGGDIIQMESDIWISEHGRLSEGDVAVTHAGTLPCKHVIHAVGPIWDGGYRGEEDLLRAAVENSLNKAAQLGLESISLPAISSGIFRFPKQLCAKIMFQTALSFFSEHADTSLKEIRFTNFDDVTCDIFEKERKRLEAERTKEEDIWGDTKEEVVEEGEEAVEE